VQVKQISEWFVQLSSEHQSLARSFFSWKPIYWPVKNPVQFWCVPAQTYSWSSYNMTLDYSLALTLHREGDVYSWEWKSPSIMKIAIFVNVSYVLECGEAGKETNSKAFGRCKCRTSEPRDVGFGMSWNRIADSCTVRCQARLVSTHGKLLNQGFRLRNGDDCVWFGSLGSDRSAVSWMVVGRWMRSGVCLADKILSTQEVKVLSR
jgi:hypothetical protein